MASEEEYRLIWFQHLHKSAGTLIVNMAINNNEVLFDNHNNGNPTNSIGEVLPIWEYSKNQLLDFINECEISGITFVATEYGPPNFKLLAEDSRVVLITCIRDPKNRIISNFNYDYYSGYTNEKSLEDFIKNPSVYTSDNYYVRVFSRKTSLPLKKLKKEDQALALINILKFDLVIKTENNNLEDKLFKKFGWSEISTNNHSTFGNKWRIINMIKRVELVKLIRYIRKKNMVSDNSILNGMFDLDYELLSKIIEE
ncbi:MAG: hypothetical protein HOB55_05440 [Euryarchaeota archaeon]|nr:hypothetical protein [Euryarchaeota archaeon]